MRHDAESVHDAMSKDILTVEPGEALPEAARRMAERNVGSALVCQTTSGERSGIFTERDVLRCVAADGGLEQQRVAEHYTPDPVALPPGSSLRRAAEEMTSGGFRHLVVRDGDRTVGVVSIRDLVGCWARQRELPGLEMPIWEAMSTDVLTVRPDDTLLETVRQMSGRRVGAVAVEPTKKGRPPGIFSARELLRSVGAGQNPDDERVADHLAPRMTFSAPGWSLSQAAEAMLKGGFQHIVVVDKRGTAGIISMRDLVRSLIGR